MTKGKTLKVTTAATPHQSLRQARLIGPNENLKSVRQKASNSCNNMLKQADLASFGFGNTSKNTDRGIEGDSLKTPPRKRRKHLSPGVEVPETQFAQNTQSPELNDHDAFGDREVEYSSPLSSPPTDEELQIPISSMVTMPPPPVPVTPKRRRVAEVPDSKSPPTTPFTPYQSQQEYRLCNQDSPTTRLSKSPMTLQVEEAEMVGGYYSQTSKQIGRSLFTPSPKRLREVKYDKEKGQEAKKGTSAGIEGLDVRMACDKDRIINSSQWWDLEDTQDASLPTQYTQNTQAQNTKILPRTQGATATSTFAFPRSQEFVISSIRDQEPFHADLSPKSDSPFEDLDIDDTPESQNATHINGHRDAQESSRIMAYQEPPELCNDTPELKDEENIALPMGGDDSRSMLKAGEVSIPLTEEDTASEDPETENDVDEIPQYDAYRTQQFPSSFWKNGGTYRHESPELLMSSQWVPRAETEDSEGNNEREPSQWIALGTANESNPASGGDGREISQWIAPEIVNVPNFVVKEDHWGPSQFLPGKSNLVTKDMKDVDLDEVESSQSLPETIIPTTELRETRNEHNIEDIPPSPTLPGPDPTMVDDDQKEREFNLGDNNDDDDSRAITRSQLLPSELMETFPMPPPLSQYSSYGYSDLNIESETQ